MSVILAAPEPPARRAQRFALVVAAHAALLWAALDLSARPQVRQAAREIMVRLVEEAPTPPRAAPPPPPPPVRQRTRPTPPPPVITATPQAAAPAASFAVAPQPPAAPVEPAAAPPAAAAPPPPAAPPPVTAARFDADYLSNPRPVYPPASRRMGEEGKVVLRVRVSAQGQADRVELHKSSGFARLDDAALEAVGRWRFVPARRGDEAVAASVLVPIVFRLDS